MTTPVLSFRLKRRAGDFTLDVAAECAGGITALFGPSGSGKTTTLNCLAGMVRPDEGEVVLNGALLYSSAQKVNLPPEHRCMGYVFQDGALFPHLSALGNIRFGYERTPPGRRRISPDEVVALLRLGPLLQRRPADLSGGERQRLALARALAASPELLLLDEPLASLDAGLRGAVIGYLRRINKQLGMPMLYVSHSVSEVIALADRALLMQGGRATAFDRPSRLALERAAGLAHGPGGVDNLLDGVVVDAGAAEGSSGTVRVGAALLHAPVGGRANGERVIVSIGSAEIILAVRRPEGLSARNIIPARLDQLEVREGRALATVDIGVPVLVEVTEGAATELGLSPGLVVYLVFKSTSIAVLDAEPS